MVLSVHFFNMQMSVICCSCVKYAIKSTLRTALWNEGICLSTTSNMHATFAPASPTSDYLNLNLNLMHQQIQVIQLTITGKKAKAYIYPLWRSNLVSDRYTWISGNADNRYQHVDAPDNRYPIWRSQRGSRSTSYAVLPPTSPILRKIGVWATRLYARIKRPSVYAATVYGSKRRGRVGRHCPQALSQTVVMTSKQASGAKQAGRGRGRCTQASLWVWRIDKHCSAHRSRFTGHAVFTCGG